MICISSGTVIAIMGLMVVCYAGGVIVGNFDKKR